MNYLLEVCLVAIALNMSTTTPVVAQSDTYAPPHCKRGSVSVARHHKRRTSARCRP